MTKHKRKTIPTMPTTKELAESNVKRIIVAHSVTVDELVDAFLACPLPESVCSDKCACERGYPHRTGTNLLTATEAKQMFEMIFGRRK
jgi:hypothetical protein